MPKVNSSGRATPKTPATWPFLVYEYVNILQKHHPDTGCRAYILTGYSSLGNPFCNSVLLRLSPAFLKTSRNLPSNLLHKSAMLRILSAACGQVGVCLPCDATISFIKLIFLCCTQVLLYNNPTPWSYSSAALLQILDKLGICQMTETPLIPDQIVLHVLMDIVAVEIPLLESDIPDTSDSFFSFQSI
jgi:hypothetical protein